MTTLAQGFADPVFDSQAAFRTVMRALALPGRIEHLATGLQPPSPLTPAAAAVCLALADFETPLWLSPTLAGSNGVTEFLRFHSGAPITREPAQAAFAVVDLRADELDLAAFAQGVPEYPDRSTTVIVICEALGGDAGDALEGPGLRGEGRLRFTPRPADFAAQWRANRAGFPLGVDLVLTAGHDLAGLPRSIRITREAA